MLDHISWTTYLVSMLAVVLVYYLWFGLRFYRKELNEYFGHNSGPSKAQTFVPSITAVMGPVAEESEQLSGSDELCFGESFRDDLTDYQNEAVSDQERLRFYREVEALIKVIADSAEPKTHFLLLAGLLIEKYASIVGGQDRDQIVQQFLDPSNGFAFELAADDLNELWREPINN